MSFRYDEAAQNGFNSVKRYLVSRDVSIEERERSEQKLLEIISEYGPVVDCYPSWHPLVYFNENDRCPAMVPNERCGYKGLDHTRYFANAFITCPYHGEEKIFESVNNLPYHPDFTIGIEHLDVQFYSANTKPILVYCEWNKPIEANHMIPASLAVPLMLEKELPCREGAQRAETWDSMRPFFLGEPHGKRSSMFVNQETALAMKKIWELLINTGAFGPIKD